MGETGWGGVVGDAYLRMASVFSVSYTYEDDKNFSARYKVPVDRFIYFRVEFESFSI